MDEILEELKKQTKILQSIESRLEGEVSANKRQKHLMFNDSEEVSLERDLTHDHTNCLDEFCNSDFPTN